MRNIGFKHWCRQMWYEHIDELESYRQAVPYTAQEYFVKYKYWLKREYRYQTSTSSSRNLSEQ